MFLVKKGAGFINKDMEIINKEGMFMIKKKRV